MTTTAETDQWSWWRAAIIAKSIDLYIEANPVNGNEPQNGFYETRSKDRRTGDITRSVVAYWRDAAGKLLCREGKNRMVDELRAIERWPFALKRPIAHATYKLVIETGKFPDENGAATNDRQNSAAAPDADTLDGIAERVDDLAREAERLIAKGAAKSIEESDQAADLADRLRKLEVKADTLRKAEKQPHMDAASTVDGQWNPIRDKAISGKDRLKKLVITPFEVAERKRMQDAADAAAKVAHEAAGPDAPEPAPFEPPPTRRVAGTAAKVALRDVKSAVIKDYGKALTYFAANAKVRDLIQQLANAAVKQGTTPDGCEIYTEQVAA